MAAPCNEPPLSTIWADILMLDDVVAEGRRLVISARATGVDVYLLGGVGIRVMCDSASFRNELARSYHDIDLATRPRTSSALSRFLEAEGYEPNRRFNAVQGETRLLFSDPGHDRQIDVFVGRFQMCHSLALEPRFAISAGTLPAADLLLLKLQIVQLNHKDVVDALALLLESTDASNPRFSLDLIYISSICASDWGWYRTLTDNLMQVRELAPGVLIDQGDVVRAQQQIDRLLGVIESAPKSLSWRVRNRIGRRIPWYDLPEEVANQSG